MKLHYYSSRLTLFFASLFVLSMTFMACGNDDDDGGMSGMTELNIVETAQDNDDFSILVQALSDAGLVGALEGDGPFTVFAPLTRHSMTCRTAL